MSYGINFRIGLLTCGTLFFLNKFVELRKTFFYNWSSREISFSQFL